MPPTTQEVPFGKTIGEARSPAASLESIVNLYPEQSPAGARSPVTLYGTPGLKAWVSGIGDGPVRGAHRMGGDLYVVSGQALFAVSSLGEKIEIGTVDGYGNVFMEDNGIHVAIAVQGGKLYAANRSGILQLPESGINGIAYQDGYLIYSAADKFWISGLDDATTIDPLDFSSADALPDDSRGCISDHRELVIFGEYSVEFWMNTGNADFPFERAGGGFMEHGCRAPGSIAKAENAIFWLGENLAPYMANGYQATPIAQPWVERLIEGASDPSTAWAFTYRQEGHLFYVLSFSDLCVVYDTSTGAWHRRKSYGLDRWRANCYAYFDNKHIVGDYSSGTLYELDLDTYDEAGTEIRREVVAPPMHAGGGRVQCDELYIDMETGVGLESGQGSAPLAMLDWTEDNGASWSNELRRSIGAQGANHTRVTFNRLGAFRHRTFRLAISDPVRVAIFGAYARMTPLAS